MRYKTKIVNYYKTKFKNYFTGDDDKLSVLHPSAAGSLSSITTTSLVSEVGASDGAGSDRGGDDRSEKQLVGIKHEKWWQTTIQVGIPFCIAGVGTIGAGIILGRVEVSSMKCKPQSSANRTL